MIECAHERQAEYLIYLFSKGLISNPPDFESKLHNDGATPIFIIPKNGPVVKFLPDRNNDETAAMAIEKVLSKAIWRYIETEEKDLSLKAKVETRFNAQLSCSSCQSLGIASQSVEDFVLKALTF